MTLGSALEVEPDTTDSCEREETTRGCLAVNTAIPGRDLVAPFDGVIVRWSVRLGNETAAQTIRLRLLQRLSTEEFEMISSGPLESVPAGAGQYTFPAEFPISKGEEVGLEAGKGKGIEYQAPLPGAHSLVFNPLTGLDASATGPPVFDNPEFEATFNVEVEPDCDHDGLGDETQDSDSSSCHPPPSESTGLPQAPKTCVVPKLKGKTLKAAKKRARKAHCGLRIKFEKGLTRIGKKAATVIKQKPRAGKVRPAGAKIAITLGLRLSTRS